MQFVWLFSSKAARVFDLSKTKFKKWRENAYPKTLINLIAKNAEVIGGLIVKVPAKDYFWVSLLCIRLCYILTYLPYKVAKNFNTTY